MKELCGLLANNTVFRQMVFADEVVVQLACKVPSLVLHRMRTDAHHDAREPTLHRVAFGIICGC